ncbi:MAG: hypothetical protein PHR78_07985 [Eubacteriales bacterium]|jgi:hypothetical protein|nr:hypothetical protein [Eubacteriales bacterium]
MSDIDELYAVLKIIPRDEHEYPEMYDTVTPYRKCTTFVETSTVIGNSTDSDKL